MRQFISSLALVALITAALRAQGAASEFKLSFQRVNQVAKTPNRTGDVSGTWSTTPDNGGAKPSSFYLLLRQKAGTFIGSYGFNEHLQIPILDLSVREGVVRFNIEHWNVELTLKDDRLLEGRITQPALGPLSGKFAASRDDPSIEYESRPLSDPVSELNRQIQAGEVRLERDCTHGYLQSVLDAFHVPIESQVAVFSKTSLQRERISPRNPRTIFFNDAVSIGWVPGGEVIEVAAQDPQQGVVFYKLDQKRADKPQFERSDNACLSCHLRGGVPSLVVSSVVPTPSGDLMTIAGPVDHRSPLERRWGGWYVTGKHGSARHLGNAVATDSDLPLSMVSDATLNLESLKDRFDTHAYLSPHSDIVALMVLDHQVHMTNLLTRMGWETRLALHQEQLMKNSPDYPPDQDPDLLAHRLGDTAREFVDYLLFIDEATLSGKIQGTSGFAEKFAAQGPRDGHGRSLRQFDLEKRLLRYPCSFMIYSRAFDGLPAEAREAIYGRMWQVLSGEEKRDRYARLSLSDRQNIVEILRETKKGLPDYFQSVVR